MNIIDQHQWGSSLIYDDGDLNGEWDPRYVIVHWGGLTSERDTFEKATATLRGWQAYHLRKDPPWQDIAYNYAIDELGNMYRLRGENHGGHTSGTDPVTGKSWSTVGVGIVWIGGQSDEDGPSPAARATMDRYTRERGLPVLGHQETGKATACPGQDWLDWIHNMEEIMPIELWHRMIDSLYIGRPDEFKPVGGEEYWKHQVPASSEEWVDFFDAFTRVLTPVFEAHEHALQEHEHAGTVVVS